MLRMLQIVRTLKVRFVRAPPTSTKPSRSKSCMADIGSLGYKFQPISTEAAKLSHLALNF